MSEYFDQRDIKNSEKIEQILTNDLPDYCREYFVGISMNTTTLTRLNYAYDIRTFFRYLVNKIYRFKGKSTKEISLVDIENLSPFEIEAYLNYVEIYRDTEGKIVKNSARGKSRKLAAIRSFVKYFIKKHPSFALHTTAMILSAFPYSLCIASAGIVPVYISSLIGSFTFFANFSI